jgi:fatty-acyl-CoA synthase
MSTRQEMLVTRLTAPSPPANFVRHVVARAIVGRANLDPFERPDRLPRAIAAMRPWGSSTAGALAAAAARYPARVAVHDDEGALIYRDAWSLARRVAAGLADEGVAPGTKVGLMCRNHRGLLVWLAALSAIGADAVLLNTGFAGPQVADVVDHEAVGFVIHDDEFSPVVKGSLARTLDEGAMARLAATERLLSPRRSAGRVVILTSGTTGRPKGAARPSAGAGYEGVASIVGRIPLRPGDVQVVAAPLFHGWGLAHLLLGVGRCATTVLDRRFDADATLRSISDHQADVVVVVPVMLARIVELPAAVLLSAPTSRLRVIASSGSAMGAELARRALDRFGPVVYNIYGSTEVAIATIATPADLGAQPETAGRAAFGVTVEILDEDGQPLPAGSVGRIFVGGAMRFGGYTTGGGKEERRGLLSTGDVGYFEDGRLFVKGREDDMIVSGAENVFPIEIEELLSHHHAVFESAVIGVPDETFGQVLAAFVVASGDLTSDDVRAYVRDNLARHKVPRHVIFVDALPRNAAGKVVRRSLAEMVPAGEEASSR